MLCGCSPAGHVAPQSWLQPGLTLRSPLQKRRYETYVKLLEARLCGGSEELEQWEARLGGSDSADEGLGLIKSHSSPSLNLDPPPAGVKVKRNISERRTVRKIIPKRNKQLL